jgi:hypothetical protein
LIAIRLAGVNISALVVVAGPAEGHSSKGRSARAYRAARAGAGLREEIGGSSAEWISGARLSIRQGDKDSVLLGEGSVAASESARVISVGYRSGKDITQIIRLFFWDRNDLLPLLVLYLLVLLFEDCGEGIFF